MASYWKPVTKLLQFFVFIHSYQMITKTKFTQMLTKYPDIAPETELTTKDLSSAVIGEILGKDNGYIDANEDTVRRHITKGIYCGRRTDGVGTPIVLTAYSVEVRTFLKSIIRSSSKIQDKQKNSLEKIGVLINRMCGDDEKNIKKSMKEGQNTTTAADNIFKGFLD